MVQAQNTDRRWSRALQHEHSLRLQLQENMEALANQMQGLEDEARKSFQPKLPFHPSLSTQNSVTSSETGDTSSINSGPTSPSLPTTPGGGIRRNTPKHQAGKKVRVFDKSSGVSEVDGVGEESDDEDKFFDAPEIPAEDWNKATGVISDASSHASTPVATGGEKFSKGHKKTLSSVSVNDARELILLPEVENLPYSLDRKLSVSF